MWQSLRCVPWLPRSYLRKVQQHKAVGQITKHCLKEQARATGHSKWLRTLLRLASPKGMQVHKSPQSTHMLRLQRKRSWGSGMPLSREGINPSPHTMVKRGQSSYQGQVCRENTHIWSKVLLKGLILGFPKFIVDTLHQITLPLCCSLMYIVASSKKSSMLAITLGPFSCEQLELVLRPFQTSLLSLVLKTSKTGKYQAVHNFSYPHKPFPDTMSVNAHIDSDDFPCTWGTFTTVTLIIAHLPPGSQASVHDMAEAYCTIPAKPDQWPGLIIHLRVDDQFAINVCNNFGLTSAGGIYGMVADVELTCSRDREWAQW